MFRQAAAGILLLISTFLAISTFVLGQPGDGLPLVPAITSADVYAPRASPVFAEKSPVFAEKENKELTLEAAALLKAVLEKTKSLNPSDPKIDRPDELFKLRTLRQEVIRVTPLLRNYADDLWQDRRVIQDNRNKVIDNSADRIQIDIYGFTNQLDRAKSELDFLQKQNADAPAAGGTQETATRIADLQNEIKSRESQLSNLEKQKTLATDRDNQARQELNKIDEEVSMFSVAIKDADDTTKSLDASLGRLDDLTGAVLTFETLSNSYTDSSTRIFGILVGIVIFGFFGIAYLSEKVRDAIFSGESGIQFVTLFSLVIAIILFGVLKILEGKELSALLGGLSGYILGRGSFLTSPPRQGGTGAAATPAPAQPAGQQPVP